MANTILTQHPQEKQGVNISRAEYGAVRAAIVAALQNNLQPQRLELTGAV